MKLSQFKELVQSNPEKPFRLVLPDQTTVPISFHITEVAHVQKRFIDCGGKLHTTDTCQLQVWEGEDTDHRLYAGKMAKVLDLAKIVLPEGKDLDVEIEYETTAISQYPVERYTVTGDAVVFSLGYKHTDCLAKETCCPAPTPTPKSLHMMPKAAAASCCAPGSGCC